MKKIYLISTIFIIGIISFFNLDSVKADTICNYTVKAFQSITSPYYSSSDDYYYTIRINVHENNKLLTFVNAYFDGHNSSNAEDIYIKQGETKTFTFDEILESDVPITIQGADGEQYELDFKPIVSNFSSCETIVYERLKMGEGSVRFRFKDEKNGDVCDDWSPDSYYGTITCVDSNDNTGIPENVCFPIVADNSYNNIKYYFPNNEENDGSELKKAEIIIELPNGVVQTLPLYVLENGMVYTFLDSRDCEECFSDFHMASSGQAKFSQYVTIIIDEELEKMIYTNKDNYSCPAKIFATLIFHEWGDTFKPQFSSLWQNSWNQYANAVNKPDKGWEDIMTILGNVQGVLANALVDYLGESTDYNYSDYNYAKIILTTYDCGDACFDIITSDNLIIINPNNNDINFGDIDDCGFLKADEFYDWISTLFKIVRIGSIILVIVLTGLDAMKTFVSFDEKNGKNFYKHLLNRLICVALLFLLPSLIELIINFFNVNDIINKIVSEPFCGLLKK